MRHIIRLVLWLLLSTPIASWFFVQVFVSFYILTRNDQQQSTQRRSENRSVEKMFSAASAMVQATTDSTTAIVRCAREWEKERRPEFSYFIGNVINHHYKRRDFILLPITGKHKNEISTKKKKKSNLEFAFCCRSTGRERISNFESHFALQKRQ